MTTDVRPSPLAILVSLFFLGNIGMAIDAAFAADALPRFVLLYEVGLGWAFSWWVLSDCRARGVPTFIDHGWFVFYAWPFIVPYHLLKTRGLRGCGTILALLGAFAAATLCAAVTYFLISVFR